MSKSRFIVGLLVLLIGLNLLFNLRLWEIIWPIVIILIGLRIIFGKNWRHYASNQGTVNENKINEVIAFNSINKRYVSDDFQGGKFVAIFAGGEIDLSGVKVTQNKVQLEVVCVFGGVKIRVPETWRVTSEGVGIIGGYNNHTTNSTASLTEVTITGVAIFGGTEIIN